MSKLKLVPYFKLSQDHINRPDIIYYQYGSISNWTAASDWMYKDRSFFGEYFYKSFPKNIRVASFSSCGGYESLVIVNADDDTDILAATDMAAIQTYEKHQAISDITRPVGTDVLYSRPFEYIKYKLEFFKDSKYYKEFDNESNKLRDKIISDYKKSIPEFNRQDM